MASVLDKWLSGYDFTTIADDLEEKSKAVQFVQGKLLSHSKPLGLPAHKTEPIFNRPMLSDESALCIIAACIDLFDNTDAINDFWEINYSPAVKVFCSMMREGGCFSGSNEFIFSGFVRLYKKYSLDGDVLRCIREVRDEQFNVELGVMRGLLQNFLSGEVIAIKTQSGLHWGLREWERNAKKYIREKILVIYTKDTVTHKNKT